VSVLDTVTTLATKQKQYIKYRRYTPQEYENQLNENKSKCLQFKWIASTHTRNWILFRQKSVC